MRRTEDKLKENAGGIFTAAGTAIGGAFGLPQIGAAVGGSIGGAISSEEPPPATQIRLQSQTAPEVSHAPRAYDRGPAMYGQPPAMMRSNMAIPALVGGGAAIASRARPLIQTIGRALRTPTGQLATGVGTGYVASRIGARGAVQPMRVSRKLTQQARSLIRMMGAEGAAAALGIDVATLAYIATKTHRQNRGITSRDMRTATRTINRVVHLHSKLEASFGKATRRRTTRRTSIGAGTRITNVK